MWNIVKTVLKRKFVSYACIRKEKNGYLKLKWSGQEKGIAKGLTSKPSTLKQMKLKELCKKRESKNTL